MIMPTKFEPYGKSKPQRSSAPVRSTRPMKPVNAPKIKRASDKGPRIPKVVGTSVKARAKAPRPERIVEKRPPTDLDELAAYTDLYCSSIPPGVVRLSMDGVVLELNAKEYDSLRATVRFETTLSITKVEECFVTCIVVTQYLIQHGVALRKYQFKGISLVRGK